jgi:protein O-GlcNAc transferase
MKTHTQGHYTVVLLSFCVAMLTVTLFPAGLARAADYFERGEAYEQQSLYAQAVSMYSEALRIDPNNIEAHYRMGVVYDKLGNPERAAQKYQDTLNLNPGHAGALSALAGQHLNRGLRYRQQGQLAEATQELKAVLQFNPASSAAHQALGEIYEEQGQQAEAMQHYQEVLRTDPDSAASHYRLGIGYEKQAQYDQAVAQFQEVLRINPDHPEAHAGLAVAYQKQGQSEEAAAAFRQAIRLYLIAGRRDLALEVKKTQDELSKK